MNKRVAFKWAAGVVGSYLLCELLLKPIIAVASNYSGTIIQSIIDYYYSLCSVSNTNTLIVEIAIYGCCFMFIQPIVSSAFDIKHLQTETKKLTQYENMLTSSQQIEETNDKGSKSEKEDLLKEIGELKVRNKNSIKREIILICLGSIGFFSLICFKIAPCAQRNKFDETIIKITPYIEQSEANKLKSDWTRMETKEEYQKIKIFIDEVIEKNELK